MRNLLCSVVCALALAHTDTLQAKKVNKGHHRTHAESAAKGTTPQAAPMPAPSAAGAPMVTPSAAATPASLPTPPPASAPPSGVAASENVTVPPPATNPLPAPAAPPAAVNTTGASTNFLGMAPLGIDLGVKVAATLPTSKLRAALAIGADAGYRLPILDGLLGVGAEFTFAQPGLSGSQISPVAGPYTYRLSMRIVTLALEGRIAHPLGPVNVYGAAGYALYFLRAQSQAFSHTQVATQTRGGPVVRVGAGYTLGPGDVFAEVRWSYVPLAFEETGPGNAGGITVGGGYRLAL